LATKMLAPTIQFSNNNQTHKKTPDPQTEARERVLSDTQQRTAPAKDQQASVFHNPLSVTTHEHSPCQL